MTKRKRVDEMRWASVYGEHAVGVLDAEYTLAAAKRVCTESGRIIRVRVVEVPRKRRKKR